MRKTICLLMSLFVLFASTFTGNNISVFAADTNLITSNPGFEGNGSGSLDGWKAQKTAKIEFTNQQAHTGSYSAKVTRNETDGSDGINMKILDLVQKGQTYTASVWIKLPEGTSDCKFNLKASEKIDGTYGTTLIKQETVSASKWTEIKGTYTVKNGNYEVLALYVNSGDGNINNFYTDDVSLVLGGTAATATAAATGNKVIDKPIVELPTSVNPITESTATVNWYDTKQTIDGFGVSEAFGKSKAILNLPEQQRNEVMDLLWSKDKGIGLSFLRNQLLGTISPEKDKYDWSQGQEQINLMNEIVKRGYDVRFMATAWSPPAWMKTTNSSIKGSLKPENYQDYANFLSKYVQEYKKQFGIDYYAVSMANEPAYEPSYDGCKWTSPQIHDFIKNNIIPTFSRDNITTKFIAAEDMSFSDRLMTDTLNDNDTANRVDIVAAHGYNNSTSPLKLATQKNKNIWMTEIMSYNNYDTSINDGLVWAKRIHNHMADANVSAWFYWWGAYTTATSNSGLIYVDNTTNQYELKKRLWTIGNYSKFVRPGYTRVSATKEPNKDVFVTAFKEDATGKLVLVVTNTNVNAQTVNVNLNGLSTTSVKPYRTSATEDLVALSDIAVSNNAFKAELPAQSVTTYVATGTSSSAVPAVIEKDDALSIGTTDAINGTPTIDGEIDSIWNNATSVSTDIMGTGSVNAEGAKAKVKTIWDENYLYVLADVTDSKLSKDSTAKYLQDSFETFIDENDGKTSGYEKDDAQYRVNFDNETSFSSNCNTTKFKSAVKKTATGYIVEEAIPLQTIKASAGTKIGLEFQVNDSVDKSNRIIAKWSNPAGDAYENTSTFGDVTLK